MSTQKMYVRLTASQVKYLDDLAKTAGITRVETLRRIIDDHKNQGGGKV